MALNTQNTDAISFKKLSGKTHTQQNFAVNEEGIASNVQLSYTTIFGDKIVSLPVTDSGLTSLYDTNGIVERVKFQVDLIPDTQIAAGRSQGYRLKLPSDYSTFGELRAYYASGTYLNTALGKLQIVPPLYGTVKPDGSTEYDPILYQTNGSSIITKFDSINWYLDMYSGVLFVQDPPAGYDISAARPGYVEAFLYVGEYLNDVVDVITSGSTGGTTANNVGGGVGIFKDKTAEILNFRTLIGVSGMSVTQTTNNIFIAYTGATGGGSGTVTGATNGLRMSGAGRKIALGGNLTGNTSIGASGSYKLIIGDLSGTGPLSGFDLYALTGMSINSIAGLLQINSNAGIAIANTSGPLTINNSGRIGLESNGFNLNLNAIGAQVNVTGNSIYHKTFTTYTISGATGFGGVRYASNYASNFNIRSLTDVGYLTGITSTLIATANNGLTKSGTNVRLGGTFTGDTSISGNTALSIYDNSIELGSSTNTIQLQRFAYNVGTGFPVSTNYGGGAMQADGKVILGGGFTTYNGITANRIVRLNYDGTFDTSFVTGTGLFGTGIAGRNFIAQSDGKIMAVGTFTTYSGATVNRIVRLNTNGSIDTSFVTGTAFNNATVGIVQQSDTKYVVAGSFTTYSGITGNHILRLNSNGSHDATFVSGAGFAGGAASPSAIAIQADNKVIAVGLFTSYSGVSKSNIVRLNTNGTVDATFNTLTFNNLVSNVVVQPDGKILLGGSFTTYNAIAQTYLIRLNSDGSIDNTFSIGSGFSASGFVSAITLQPDGKILVAGEFTTYNGNSRNRMIRLNSDGSLDTTFVIGTGFNSGSGGITAILLEPNGSGRMVVFGSFTTYNGLSRNRVIKLDAFGSALGNALIKSRPAEYTTNMSASFGDRSIPDVGYVKSLISIATGATPIITANNGLVKVGNNIRIGGSLTGNTTITTATGSRLTIAGWPLMYATDLSANYTARSLVDAGWITGQSNTRRVQITTATSFTASTSSSFIGCSGTTVNVYLPAAPLLGQEITICDIQGDGFTNPITIYGNGKLLDGDTTAGIDSEYGTITFLYNGITWSITAFAV